MNQMTRFSMKNISAVLLISIFLFIGGSFSATTLKQEAMPDISLPQVFVTTVYPATPMDVMEDVTKKLEKLIVGIEGMKKVTSSSNENYSMLTVELRNDASVDKAVDEIERAISDVKLPASADKPKVSKVGSSSYPVYFAAMHGKGNTTQEDLNSIYKDIVEPVLSTMKGIDHVDSAGLQEATLKLKLDLNALNTYGLTPSVVTQSIQAALATSPAGTADLNGTTQSVRIESDLDTIYNLENMKIMTSSGQTVLLKQISKVEAIMDSEYITRFDNDNAIGLTLFKGKDANTVEFANEIDRLFANWEKEYPNIQFSTVYNSANDVKKSVIGMLEEGGIGAILASVMILLFLRNVRMTLMVLVSIPLSIVTTLSIMSYMDLSLNVMTLGGLTVAVGRVVDDSIVVIENIYSELQKAHERNESVILLATSKVASAITSSTLVTCGVFLPMAFVSGILGDVFRPFSLTIVVAMLTSLVVALTMIPVLSKLLVLNSKIKHHDENAVGKSGEFYRKVLNYSLHNPIKIMITTVLIFVISIGGTVPFLGSTFIPADDSNKQILFTLQLPRETSFDSMNEEIKEIEKMLGEAKDTNGQPEFDYYEAMVGYDQANMSGERTDYKSTIVAAVGANVDVNKAIDKYKGKIKDMVPKGSEIEGSPLAGTMGSAEDFAYILKGDDLNQLMAAAELVKTKLAEFPELDQIKDSLSEKKMQITVKVDQNKARIYGLSSAMITSTVAEWLKENEIGEIKFDNVNFTTKIMIDEKFKDSLEEIGRIRLTTPTGAIVALNEVAKTAQIDAPASITREMQQQYVKVTAKIDSTDKGGVVSKLTTALKSVELPNGIRREVQGVSEDIQASFTQLIVAMAAAIVIVYLIMVIAFGNASAPFAVMFSLPLAAIGGFVGLFVTKEPLSITSMIGFLMLIGIVITNAIVLIDRVQQLREEGYVLHEALILAGISRLRPIIMTAGATVFSQLPMALGLSGGGTIISKGMSVVVIGGLVTSTILTLVVVPIIYLLIEKAKLQMARLFKRKGSTQTDISAVSSI
ncbi:efflux RND transporter permease subunit [Paenibacillus alba]|uniref:efflux RND transporter permease subunit n=1 Tax=Paenibacillus alba TaxID=1197127 RepID=UPI00156729A9|nr:efflux RND transporter permease subunit [Paenibacillus alba]NQX68000.1 efflux RND transporter permease subunit [Paenibacillus alba]